MDERSLRTRIEDGELVRLSTPWGFVFVDDVKTLDRLLEATREHIIAHKNDPLPWEKP